MHNNKNTFCVAPWFQIKNGQDMSKEVCCAISTEITEHMPSQNMSSLEYLNTQPIRDLKKDLANGVRSEHCRICWLKEENGIRSLRQDLNELISLQKDINAANWMDVYFKTKMTLTVIWF